MPRSSTTPKSVRANPKGGKKPPSPPFEYRCPEPGCPWSYPRDSDLHRHSFTHMSEAERDAYMYACPHPGCLHKTLQRSNLVTHYRTHSGEKPKICPDCRFATGDPATLTLHRKSKHGYVPRADAPNRDTTAPNAASSSHQAASPSPPASQSSQSSQPSSSRSSSPGSAYSELSMQSWVTSSSLSAYSYSNRYPQPGARSNNNFSYPDGSSVSVALAPASTWNGGVAFDMAADHMDFAHMDLCAMPVTTYGPRVGSTVRPGPSVLYPATALDVLQSAELFTEAELTALLEHAAGLTSAVPADADVCSGYLTLAPAPVPEIDWDTLCAVEPEPEPEPEPVPVRRQRQRNFSLGLEDPVTYHANTELDTLFDDEWTLVVPK